jgi:crossover junction endodeoxyribonuclease RuvC
MTLLALDLGSKLGWAVAYGRADEQPADILHGTIEFRPGRHEGGGMQWLRFRKWLTEMHEQHGPVEAVHYEEVRAHKGTAAAHIYGGFLATLTAWCEAKEVPYQGIPVGTIKRTWTGKGNSNKEAMIAEARKRGFNPETDNDADALALLHCVMETTA